MSKIKLSKDDILKLEKAVEKAEKNTSGEIATALIKESYNYGFQELLFSVIMGWFYLFVSMFFYNSIHTFVSKFVWEHEDFYVTMFYGFSTLIVIVVIYFLSNIASIDRLIVSKKYMAKKVGERAVIEFMSSGVYKTRDRTGILIFISELEHRVELIADSGISEKIPQETWDNIVKNIIDGIKNRTFVNNFVESIDKCGELLSEHFPIKHDDTNELSNKINILKK